PAVDRTALHTRAQVGPGLEHPQMRIDPAGDRQLRDAGEVKRDRQREHRTLAHERGGVAATRGGDQVDCSAFVFWAPPAPVAHPADQAVELRVAHRGFNPRTRVSLIKSISSQSAVGSYARVDSARSPSTSRSRSID